MMEMVLGMHLLFHAFFFVLLLTLRKVIHYLCILPKEQDIHLQFSLCPLVFVLPQAIFV